MLPPRKNGKKKKPLPRKDAVARANRTGFARHLGEDPTKQLAAVRRGYAAGTMPEHIARPKAIRAAGEQRRMDLEMSGANYYAGTPPPRPRPAPERDDRSGMKNGKKKNGKKRNGKKI